MNKDSKTSFVDLDSMIEEDIRNNIPSELDCLSTHTYIDDVANISIENEEIEGNIATLQGTGTIYLELQYNSDYDNRIGDGLRENMHFDFQFNIKLDVNKNTILESDYSFDTEKFFS